MGEEGPDMGKEESSSVVRGRRTQKARSLLLKVFT